MTKSKKIIIGTAGFIVLFLGLILAGFAYLFSDIIREEYALSREDKAPIEIKELHQKNPTSYTFDRNVWEIRKKIIPALEYPEYDSPYPFKPSDSPEMVSYMRFHVCEADKDDGYCPPYREKILEQIYSKKENANDLYLAHDGNRFVSTTYYADGKPLETNMDFHIHLETIEDNQTKVTIFPIKPLVYKGKGGRGMHGGRLKKEIPVEPTTVEEYQLLRYIGFVLSEKDMPEVIIPK